jgi:hypothetical protein
MADVLSQLQNEATLLLEMGLKKSIQNPDLEVAKKFPLGENCKWRTRAWCAANS